MMRRVGIELVPAEGRAPRVGPSCEAASLVEPQVSADADELLIEGRTTHARLHLVMRLACYGQVVPKTVQIRDLDDEVYARLARRAAEAGVSVPELLRTEATRLAARPSVEEWLSRTRRRAAAVGRLEVLAALDEQRGPWPDAGS